MQPNNLTALDFEDIKSSIKTYLRTREEFTDYDFDGSSLSYLVDLLAYNTYYTSFNANMAMNEAFIASSTVRDNIVNIAKLLNYNPRSVKASTAYLHIQVQTIQTSGVYPNNITISAGPIATGGSYIWNLLDPVTVEVNQSTGIADFRCVKIQEGSIITYSYTVDNFSRQKYIIPAQSVDTSTLKVRVKDNASSTTSDVYNVVENITNVTATDRVYFINETEDLRYEIIFGDGVVGKKLGDGQVIDLEYLITSGSEGNGVSDFTFVGTIIDSVGVSYDNNVIDLVVAENSKFGDSEESVESIKFNAPRWYAAQYRAVTTSDYETIVKKIYPNAGSVVAFGGDEIYPPVYGKVFIAIKTKTGSKLNDTTKASISQQLRPYAMASIEPVIRDADSVYIYSRVYITYDPACSGRSVSTINSNAQKSIVDWAQQTGINNFNGSFSLSKFQRAITLSDRCISDISTQLNLLKYMNPTAGETNTYCISTGAPLYNSAPGVEGDGSGCTKEPVIKSSRFRTLDRPLVDQYFEDDGFGNLVTYYNSGNRKIITNAKAGTVDYDRGDICFGPVNIIGAGGNNLPTTTGAELTDLTDDDVYTVDTSSTAVSDLGAIRIAVTIIPSNTSVIIAPTPSTVIEIIVPTITVNPIGSILPPNIPLNSLTPSDFESVPTTIDIPDIANNGDLANISCF